MQISTQILVGAVTGVLTAGLAFLGAWLGQRLDYRRWHREETMRLLRWAADKALATHEPTSEAGVAALAALLHARLLQDEDADFVEEIAVGIASTRLRRYPKTVELARVDPEGDGDE